MDVHKLDDWVTIHRKVGEYSHNPLQEDSTMEQTLCLRGANFKVKWTMVEFEPPHLAVMEGRGPARSHAKIRDELTETADGGTRFSYVNEFKAPMGPLGAAASRVVMGGVPEREANRSLERLKAMLENGRPG